MSSYVLELLGREHDRDGFECGLESIDRYLKETARGHAEKNLSRTRVLVHADARPLKPIIGFFTLTQVSVEAKTWPGVARSLPSLPVPAILLSRMGVAKGAQGAGVSRMLMAAATQLAAETIERCGGVGLVVDAANADLIGFYRRFGFVQISPGSLRLFLPTASLENEARIPSA